LHAYWEHVPAFEEKFLGIEITRSLFEFGEKRLTCSGGIAALDMMVALIGRDHGQELATAVSEWLLHTQVREGVGLQRMDLRFRLGVADEKLLTVLRIMESNLEAPVAREALAEIAEVSLRQLERGFRTQLGRGLHEHYLALRLGRARQLLRESSMPILEIAIPTGFASSSRFSHAFRQAFKISPREMRVP
jgi:AraC family carnitine catabolism transcriptional activator